MQDWSVVIISAFILYRVQTVDSDEQTLEVNDGPGILDGEEEDLQRALALSRQQIDMEDEEADLRRAIQLSMQGTDILTGLFIVKELIQMILGFLEVNELLDVL